MDPSTPRSPVSQTPPIRWGRKRRSRSPFPRTWQDPSSVLRAREFEPFGLSREPKSSLGKAEKADRVPMTESSRSPEPRNKSRMPNISFRWQFVSTLEQENKHQYSGSTLTYGSINDKNESMNKIFGPL